MMMRYINLRFTCLLTYMLPWPISVHHNPNAISIGSAVLQAHDCNRLTDRLCY